MKSIIQLVPTTNMSQEDWLRYRKRGIGASEVAIVMGLSPYKASIQLFYEKIGEDLGFNIENLQKFLGKEQEPFLATLWEFWDPANPGHEQMIANYRAGRKIRRCKRVNAYANNPAYPWLFVSLDREINQYDGRGNGALELNTIGGYEADKWEAGFPPGYVVQLQTQIGVCEYLFGESAVMKDNRDYFVLPFEQNATIFEAIVTETKKFWDKVEEGRKMGITDEMTRAMFKEAGLPAIYKQSDPTYRYSAAKDSPLQASLADLAKFLYDEKVLQKHVDVAPLVDGTFMAEVLAAHKK